MSNLNLTDEVAKAKREFRAIKAQGLTTPPSSTRLDTGASGKITVPTGGSGYDDYLVKVTFTPDDSTITSTACQLWISDETVVPPNDYDIDLSWVGVSQTGWNTWAIIVPSNGITSDWVVGVRITSLVKGTVTLVNEGTV